MPEALSHQARGMVPTSGVRITQRRVQENIGNAAAPDVDGLGRDVRKDDAVGVDATAGRLGPDARLPVGRKRSSHSTDCGTRRRMLHHVVKVSGRTAVKHRYI